MFLKLICGGGGGSYCNLICKSQPLLSIRSSFSPPPRTPTAEMAPLFQEALFLRKIVYHPSAER